MEMISTIIVENEKQNSDYLRDMLAAYYEGITVLHTCGTTKESVEKILELRPQLVFLDVRLENNMSGFEILELTRKVPYDVIFTTGHSEYAVQAFKVCAIDYLLKPFGLHDLQAAMDKYFSKALNITAKSREALLYNYRQTNKAMHKAGIPTADGIDFIPVSEIIYCSASGNYTEIYLTGGKKILASKTLGVIEDLLSSHVFFRVHNSSLVNLNHIVKYKSKSEAGLLTLKDNHEVNVSKRKKEEFLKILDHLKIT